MPDRVPDRARVTSEPQPEAAPRTAAGGFAGFSRQITVPPFVLDARRPGRRPPPRPPAAAGDHALPCVLLLSRAHDDELDAVCARLGRAGVPFARLDSDELDGVDLLVDELTGQVCVSGRRLAPTVTWVRHFASASIEDLGGPVSQMFVRESWAAVASQLAAISGVTIQAERPGILAQLRLARRLGIAVPRSVITTVPRRAARSLQTPTLVVKAAHQHFVEAAPGRLSGIFPVVVARHQMAGSDACGPPVAVQEYVEHDAELRVYYLAGQVEGFAVGKATPADPWLAPGRVTARQAVLPAAVVSATKRLAAALSLRYGAFDFLLCGNRPVFLEANPDGDWRWLEALAGAAPVTAAAARMLGRLHRARIPAGRGQPQPFDLLRFLSG